MVQLYADNGMEGPQGIDGISSTEISHSLGVKGGIATLSMSFIYSEGAVPRCTHGMQQKRSPHKTQHRPSGTPVIAVPLVHSQMSFGALPSFHRYSLPQFALPIPEVTRLYRQYPLLCHSFNSNEHLGLRGDR